jgi:hypothetical protein
MSVFSRLSARALRVFGTSGGRRARRRGDRLERRRLARRNGPGRLHGPGRLWRHEPLERRELLTWVAVVANGQLNISETAGTIGQQGATGVLKVDPVTNQILLDGNDSGSFSPTGISLGTLTSSIQINAGLSRGSQFIIDNTGGGFFNVTGFILPLSPTNPTFVYNGGSAPQSNSSLSVLGRSDMDDQFTVNNPVTNGGNLVINEIQPNTLVQLNEFITYTGATGNLLLDGRGTSASGLGDSLTLNGAGGTWTVGHDVATGLPNIQGPAPLTPPGQTPPKPGTVGQMLYQNFADRPALGVTINSGSKGEVDVNSTATLITINAAPTVTIKEPVANNIVVNGAATVLTVDGTGLGDFYFVGQSEDPNYSFNYQTVARVQPSSIGDPDVMAQPDPPQSAHIGGDINFQIGSVATLNVAGFGGNNVFTMQVPPVLLPGFKSVTLPATVAFFGDVPPNFTAPPGVPLPPVGDNRLRVYGNRPIANLTLGADSITVNDFGTGQFQMEQIQSLVIYGLGGNDVLTNGSTGIKALSIPPVPAMIIAGNADPEHDFDVDNVAPGTPLNDINDSNVSQDGSTLTSGAGNDLLLGGAGKNDFKSGDLLGATTYLLPHQDEFGTIYDVGDSTIKGGNGNDTVVRGDRAPQSLTDPGDMDTISGFGGTKVGNIDTVIDTVPATNPTAYLYEPTPALIAEEQAFATNKAALEEFGSNVNLRGQFTTYAAFVGRAYATYLIGHNGRTTVSQDEINFWVSQGLPLEQMMAQILASQERRMIDIESTSWVRDMIQDTTGHAATNDEINAFVTPLEFQGDTQALRFAEALQFLTSPDGRAGLIDQMYTDFFPGNLTPSDTDMTAIQAELAAGTPLTQVATMLFDSGGQFLNFVVANNAGEIGYVGGLYDTLFNRAGNFSINELAFWADLHGVGVSNEQITLDLLNAPEHRAIVINADFVKYLHRGVDLGGLEFWQGYLGAGGTEEGLVSSIVASTEYYVNSGGTSDSFIRALYRDVLGRTTPPVQFEVDFWIATMAASSGDPNQARADVVLQFQFTDEYRISQTNQWYAQFLGRAPSPTELASALSMFHAGQTQQEVQATILVSRQTFGTPVQIP